MRRPLLPAELLTHWHEPWRYAHVSWLQGDTAPAQWACFQQAGVTVQRLGATRWFEHFHMPASMLLQTPPRGFAGFPAARADAAAAGFGLWLASSLRMPDLQTRCRQALSAGVGARQVRNMLALSTPGCAPALVSRVQALPSPDLISLGLLTLQALLAPWHEISWPRVAWCFAASACPAVSGVSGVSGAPGTSAAVDAPLPAETIAAGPQALIAWNALCHSLAVGRE